MPGEYCVRVACPSTRASSNGMKGGGRHEDGWGTEKRAAVLSGGSEYCKDNDKEGKNDTIYIIINMNNITKRYSHFNILHN